MRFSDRVVVITGAGHGIGQASAERFHREGATLALLDSDTDAARRVADALAGRPDGAEALAVACDVCETAQVGAAIDEVVSRFGRVDALISVAGADEATDDPLDDDHWRRIVDLNLLGHVRIARACLPYLAVRGGAVVMVGSVNGLAAFGEPAYSSAKAGLSVLARNLAVAHGPQGVRVNVVAPGTVRTRNWDSAPGGADSMRPLYPLGRVGEPDDIAAALAFLASDDASWITGVTLPVDGGGLAGPLTTMRTTGMLGAAEHRDPAGEGGSA